MSPFLLYTLNILQWFNIQLLELTQASFKPSSFLTYLPLTDSFLPTPSSGLSRRQHEDADGRVPEPRRQQLWRDAEYPEVCQPCQKHQEQAQDQRGPQGRHAEGVPGGDTQAEGDARETRTAGDQWVLTGVKEEGEGRQGEKKRGLEKRDDEREKEKIN